MSKNCECGAEIADKYEICYACLQKKKETEQKSGNQEVIDALSAINNNLYAIRRLLAIDIREKYKKEIVWKNKDFAEQKTK